MKSVETASSLIDLNLSDEYYDKELAVSKSQELNSNVLDTKLQEDVLEWFQVNRNKLDVKLWDKKLRRIAERLQIPGEEEKLKTKMEKYLKRVPSQFSEFDEDRKNLRQELPNLFITTLKKFYLRPEETSPISVYQAKTPKCYTRNEDNFRDIIKMWLKGIYFKKRDYLGRIVKRNDILEFINRKLQLFVKDRQTTANEIYATSLKCEIKDIIKELPILTESINKKDFVCRQTDKLLNELLKCDIIKTKINKTENEELSFKNRQQLSAKEIKDFVRNEIMVFFQKSHLGISTNGIARLETDLTDILLDATDYLENDMVCKFKDEVYIVLQNVGKFTNSQAKEFTSSLFKHLQNTLIAKNEKSQLLKSLLNLNHSETYVVYQVEGQKNYANKNETENPNMKEVTESDLNANKNQYAMAIVNQIQEWLANMEESISQDEEFLQVAVKDLAGDIVDRYKFLELNPGTRGSDEEELEYLKYQIFKWVSHLVGDDIDIGKHAPELMRRIHNTFVSIVSGPQDNVNQKLPNQHTNKPLREREEDQKLIDPKQEMLRITKYEDIIDDWIDKVPKPKKSESIFTNTKKEHVHELAVNINKIKHNIDHLTTDEVADNLKDAVLQWMKILPSYAKASKTSNRDDITNNLVQRIQQCNIDDYIIRENKADRQLPANQQNNPSEISSPNLDIVRDVITDWSRNLPLRPVYCPTEFSSLIARMAAEVTNLLAHPKYSTVAENGKEIMRTIFLYLRDFPLKTENQVHEQISRMAYLLWRHFIDMDLCKDDSGNSSSIKFVRRRNVRTYDTPLNFQPQSSGPEPNTSQVAGPSGKNFLYRGAGDPKRQNLYPESLELANINADEVRQLRMFGPTGPGGSMTDNRHNVLSNRRISYPNNLKFGPITNDRQFPGVGNVQPKSRYLLDNPEIPQGLQTEELLSYNKAIIVELCKQLPFPNSVAESDVDILRNIMQICIGSTFDTIAADNAIGDDYVYVEYIFEHKINELLKEYPQSPELNRVREVWVSKVIARMMDSLSYYHRLTDTDSFRRKLEMGYKRQEVREYMEEASERFLQEFITLVVYIFLKDYKDEDTVKANSYRRRLMNKLEGFCRNIARKFNNDFKNINHKLLSKKALQYLHRLPKTDTIISIDEEQGILLFEEVDKWYQDLPLRPMTENSLLRRRRIELLSQKIFALEKEINKDFGNSLLENKIKHEVSKFLENEGQLKTKEDLNINLMVDDLINRLKKIGNKPPLLGYKSFGAEIPASSSFFHINPRASLAVQQTGSCTGQIPAAAFGPCLLATGPATQAVLGTSQIVAPGTLPCQPTLNQAQPTVGQQLTSTSHVAGSSTMPYRPCIGQDQPIVTQQLTAESGTQIPKSCNRSVAGPVGVSTQAPSGIQSGQTTPSTARITTAKPVGSQKSRELEEESDEDTDERRRRCRCKYRNRKRRRYYYPDLDDDRGPRCYPMPMFYPYRCFY